MEIYKNCNKNKRFSKRKFSLANSKNLENLEIYSAYVYVDTLYNFFIPS